jgi:hypothetical protein
MQGGAVATDNGEQGLVDGLRSDDPDALASLFDRYGDRIYNHCFRATGGRWPPCRHRRTSPTMQSG